ncbi:MAG TPA: Ku protein [Bryobacteraceae bacterium]|jgi:DNA end-binding protein Ku|nr:Ku protein [Bryobacteraceae bacterium]
MAAIVWKGYISFGLVSFPIRLYSAARAEGVHFHLLHRKDLSRVKEVWYCAEEDKPITRADIVKGYETSKDEYVVVDDEELKNVAPATATTMDILQFVHEADVDPLYFESSYYVAPGEELTKPYAVFSRAMKESKFGAIAKLSMHGREHVVLIRSVGDSLLLHTLFYQDELHEANKTGTSSKNAPSAKEVTLAIQLIKQLAGPFKPAEFHDTYRENVEKLIAQKKKGERVTTEPKPKRAPVIDLMEALKKSLKSSAPAKGAKAKSTASRKHKAA